MDNPLNFMLANGNKLSMSSDNSIAISTNGESANYADIITSQIALETNNDINIDNLKVNNAEIKTTTNNINIGNMDIKTSAVLETANKRVVVNNTSLKPIIDSDVQMYLTNQPTYIHINGSNNIETNPVNVVRNNQHILILQDNYYNSMNSTTTASAEANIKNTKVGEKTIEKTDKLLYTISTAHNYVQSVIGNIIASQNRLVKTYRGDDVTQQNVMDTINNSVKSQIYNVNQKKEVSENSEEENKLGLL